MQTASAKLRAAGARSGFDPCAARVGVIVDVTGDGRVLVDYEGNTMGPMAARCAAGLLSGASRGVQDEVVLLFENGDPSRPLVVALLGRACEEPAKVVELKRMGAAPRECVLDGEKLVFEARKEIVLRCGEGSITLRADGKIVLKGREIVSRAFESNKIKGSTVNIN